MGFNSGFKGLMYEARDMYKGK